jgi:hypothetical protein
MKVLFGNLEFAGFDNLSFLVSQLVDIDALVVGRKVNRGFWSHVFSFIYLLAQEIEDLNRISFIISFLEIECNNRNGRIRIIFHNPLYRILRRVNPRLPL